MFRRSPGGQVTGRTKRAGSRRRVRAIGKIPERALEMNDHWDRFLALWEEILPPLRPAPSTVRAFRDAAPPAGRDVLVLGVTPELAALGGRTTAVDRSRGMIDALWPEDGDDCRAVTADWRTLPLADGAVDVVYGDGAVNVLRFPEEVSAALAEVRRVLAPAGRAVFRVYCTPHPPEPLHELARNERAGEPENVFSVKWRLAMARVAERGRPSIEVPDLLETFDATFPDRDALAAATGFPLRLIDTVDLWRDSEEIFSFPVLDRAVEITEAHFDRVEVTGSGDYPLSDRCPLLVCRKGGG